jgi:molybdopterin molybdotransferase
MIEYSECAGDNIAIYEAVAPGAGIALAGEDLKKGELLLRRGTLIRAQEIGALSAAGICNVPVIVPLRLSLVSTGDELIPPELVPCPGEVRDINTYALKALALKHGYNVISAQLFPDDKARLENALTEAKTLSDIVIISGGSSQGNKDLTADLINHTAKPGVFTHGLAVKPGKPTILGWDEESKTLFAGLPGHPVSAMMVFELLLGPLNDRYFFNHSPTEEFFNRRRSFPVPARISCNVPGSPGRMVCLPVTLRYNEGSYTAEPVFGKSGMITTLTQADGYIIIDLNTEGLEKDQDVLVHLF